MPNELAMEMKNHVADTDRWIKASQLFTLIFSSGHKPPINIDEHINEKFFSHQFDLCEGFDINGETIECNIPSENIISPILSFNLHINDIAENVIFKALGKRTNASHFTENLISYLNWEEDIIHTSCSLNRNQLNLDDHGVIGGGSRFATLDSKESKDNCIDDDEDDDKDDQNQRQYYRGNSVLKFLTEMFADKIVSSLFYYNDVRVIIDIIISQLNNLPIGDEVGDLDV